MPGYNDCLGQAGSQDCHSDCQAVCFGNCSIVAWAQVCSGESDSLKWQVAFALYRSCCTTGCESMCKWRQPPQCARTRTTEHSSTLQCNPSHAGLKDSSAAIVIPIQVHKSRPAERTCTEQLGHNWLACPCAVVSAQPKSKAFA
jgi:hypothetical protein